MKHKCYILQHYDYCLILNVFRWNNASKKGKKMKPFNENSFIQSHSLTIFSQIMNRIEESTD